MRLRPVRYRERAPSARAFRRGLGRGDAAPFPGWQIAENNPHPVADLDGVYPFKRNLGEGGGATKRG